MEDVTSSLDSNKRLGKSMATATETVKAFCVQFSKSKLGMHEAIRAYFTPTTVWENVGLVVTTGIDEALGVLAQFNQAMGIDAIDIEMLAIVADGDRVLTERLRELEAEGIVERLVDPGPPVRVSYRLTSRGHALEPVFGAVKEWAESWLEPVAAVAG